MLFCSEMLTLLALMWHVASGSRKTATLKTLKTGNDLIKTVKTHCSVSGRGGQNQAGSPNNPTESKGANNNPKSGRVQHENGKNGWKKGTLGNLWPTDKWVREAGKQA